MSDGYVQIKYTNYRQVTAIRTILPGRIWFGTTKRHPQPQWLLDAFDVDKQEHRSFAMADISSWEAR